MKKIWVVIISLFILSCPGWTVIAADTNTEYEGWTTCTEGEVQFLVPPAWEVIRHPAEGIRVQITPDASLGETSFAYLERGNMPFSFELLAEMEIEKEFLDEFALRMLRWIELQGFIADLKSHEMTEINTYKALKFYYEISSISGDMGFCHMTGIMIPNVFYGFMGMSTGNNQQEDQEIFEKIIQSVEIDTSKIPTDFDSKSYEETIQNVQKTLDFMLQSMPDGWEWKLKALEMGEEEQAQDLFIHLSLNRSDTLALAEGYAIVFKAFKKGIEPRIDQIKCNPDMLNIFVTHISMIFGGAASGTAGNQAFPVNRIYIDVSDSQGNTSKKCSIEVHAFLEALQTKNEQKMLQSMGCE